MAVQIPSVDELQRLLSGLGHKEVQDLARDSGVPFTTIWKVKDGTTTNPGVETVRKFWPLLVKKAGKRVPAHATCAQSHEAKKAFTQGDDFTSIDNSSKG